MRSMSGRPIPRHQTDERRERIQQASFAAMRSIKAAAPRGRQRRRSTQGRSFRTAQVVCILRALRCRRSASGKHDAAEACAAGRSGSTSRSGTSSPRSPLSHQRSGCERTPERCPEEWPSSRPSGVTHEEPVVRRCLGEPASTALMTLNVVRSTIPAWAPASSHAASHRARCLCVRALLRIQSRHPVF